MLRDEVLAELPHRARGRTAEPPVGGRSAATFTDSSYSEADRLSKRNKEFIRGLFPQGEIYASLLPQRAQAVIGAVGEQTRGVEKLLRRVGFQYAARVDPFDGGPHFTARTDDVSLVRATRRVELSHSEAMRLTERVLLAKRIATAPYFAAYPVLAEYRDARTLAVDLVTLTRFEAMGPGATWVLPLTPV